MKYNKDTSIIHKRLTDDENKEVNKRTRAMQQSLNYRRNNPKSQLKNTVAALALGATGAGLGYGAVKGGSKLLNKAHKFKANRINNKFYNTIHANRDELEKAKEIKDMLLSKNDNRINNIKIMAKYQGLAPTIISTGAMVGMGTGYALRDSHEVKKFFKEKYGDNPYSSIRMNEKKKVLDQREKNAFDIINESFEKIATYNAK